MGFMPKMTIVYYASEVSESEVMVFCLNGANLMMTDLKVLLLFDRR